MVTVTHEANPLSYVINEFTTRDKTNRADLIIFCAAGLKMFVKNLCFRIAACEYE